MNTEERDFQIEDNVDFGSAETTDNDLTPEITDFDEPQSEPVEVETGEDFTTPEESSDDSAYSTNTEVEEFSDQKETSPSQPRVMRYEDFVKNL